jgi:hypothetical protein
MWKIGRFPGLAAMLAAASLVGAAQADPGAAGHDQMLRQLILDTAQGRIPYHALSPGLAGAVRPQAATAQSELSALGGLRSVTLQATDKDGVEIYRTIFEKGVLDWAFHVDGKGLIDNAIYRPVKAPAS